MERQHGVQPLQCLAGSLAGGRTRSPCAEVVQVVLARVEVHVKKPVKEPRSPWRMTEVVVEEESEVQVEVQGRPCASLERQLDSASDCRHVMAARNGRHASDCRHRHRHGCLSRRRHRRPLSTVEMRTRETKVCRP